MKLKVRYLVLLTQLLLALLLLLKIKYLVFVIQSKKADHNTEVNETEKKITDHNHDKYIAAPEISKAAAESFVLRLKQQNLAGISDIANFVKKIDFDNKLKDFTWNKNGLNKLSTQVKPISTKILTKDLISLVFLLEKKVFLQEYFKSIQYLHQLKNALLVFYWHYSD